MAAPAPSAGVAPAGGAEGPAAAAPAGGPQLSPDNYIGCLLSLTSKSDIRYEGVLYTMDTKEATIALQDGMRRLAKARCGSTLSWPRVLLFAWLLCFESTVLI